MLHLWGTLVAWDPCDRQQGCGKQRDVADWPGGRTQKHSLTFFRSLPRAHGKPDILPDSASHECPRFIPEVTSFRWLKTEIAKKDPLPFLNWQIWGRVPSAVELPLQSREKRMLCFSCF